MYYDVVFEVNRDQAMFFVVHIDYDVLSEIIHDRTIFYLAHVDYDVFSKVIIDQTLFHVVHTWTTIRPLLGESWPDDDLSSPTGLGRRVRGQS